MVSAVPPLHSGDTGDGHGDDEHDDVAGDPADDVEFRPPLPRDDRLWRHPSEVALEGTPATPPVSAPTAAPSSASTSTARTAAMLVASGLIGATLAIGGVAAFGGFDERVVEQRVAVQPLTSLPAAGARGDLVATVAAATAPAVAAIRVHHGDDTADGSAVVFRSDGYLITTGHLVDGADGIDVTFHHGPAGEATIVGIDPVTDVAVLHVDQDGLQTATFGSADGLAVGVQAVAIGATADGSWDTAVSTGVVSAMGRRLQAPDGTVLHDMILIDTPFAPGAAGGALVDTSGAVVGLTSGIPASAGDDGSSFGVATPIDIAHVVADEIIDDGRAHHVWLGVQGADLGSQDAMDLGLTGAAVVDEVLPDGPAAVAGVEADDVIVGVGERPVGSMSDLISALRRHRPGDEVVLWIQRGDELLSITVALGTMPDDR